MVVTDDADLAETMRSLRNQGRDADGTWLRHVRLGYNYRLDEMSAAVGVAQMERLAELRAGSRSRRPRPTRRRSAGEDWVTPAARRARARRSTGSSTSSGLDPTIDRDAVMDRLAAARGPVAAVLQPDPSPAVLPRAVRLPAGRLPGHGAGRRRRRSRCRSRAGSPTRTSPTSPTALAAGDRMPLPAESTAPGPARRLWIVNHYADAPDRANGTRHFDLARRWSADGRDVTIFASGFSHVTGREERLGRGRLCADAALRWASGSSGSGRFPYRGNGWRRQVNMLSFLAVLLVVQARLRRPDTIIGSTVHPFAALGAWLVARLRGARSSSRSATCGPRRSSTWVRCGSARPGERLLRSIEAFLVRRASDRHHAAARDARLPLERGLPADHVQYLPNGVDLEAFDAGSAASRRPRRVASPRAPSSRTARARAGSSSATSAPSAGSTTSPRSSRRGRDRRARAPGRVGLIIIGDGPERDALAGSLAGGRRRPWTSCAAVPKRSVPVVLAALDAGGRPRDGEPGLPLRDQLQQAVRVLGRGSAGRSSPARAPTIRSRPRAPGSRSRRTTRNASPRHSWIWHGAIPRNVRGWARRVARMPLGSTTSPGSRPPWPRSATGRRPAVRPRGCPRSRCCR